jgi:hypothetical protein
MPISDSFGWAEFLQKPELMRQLLRQAEQEKNKQYILPGGEIRQARYSQKGTNSVIDLSAEQSAVSAFGACNVNGTGGFIVDDGDFRVHIFTASGSFTASCAGTMDVLIIAGGGGGGALGGGGAGRLIYSAGYSLTAGGVFNVVVGTGGAGYVAGTGNGRGGNGTASSFNGMIAAGGGGGGGYSDTEGTGNNGGSGGGGGQNIAYASQVGGTAQGSFGQGSNGGAGQALGGPGNQSGGGGGGAGGAGITGGFGGTGGAGVSISITGTAKTYAAGGGASGSIGGGEGGSSNTGGFGATHLVRPAGSPVAATGSGGGAGYLAEYSGTAGANGIVIFRYRRTSASGSTGGGGGGGGGGTPPIPIPEPNPEEEETDCDLCISRILVSATGDILASRTGKVLMSRATA